jgi:hypothetical protein
VRCGTSGKGGKMHLGIWDEEDSLLMLRWEEVDKTDVTLLDIIQIDTVRLFMLFTPR